MILDSDVELELFPFLDEMSQSMIQKILRSAKNYLQMENLNWR